MRLNEPLSSSHAENNKRNKSKLLENARYYKYQLDDFNKTQLHDRSSPRKSKLEREKRRRVNGTLDERGEERERERNSVI